MIARLEKVYPQIANEVNEPVLLRYAPRPGSWCKVLERFRLPDPCERIPYDRFNKVQDTKGGLSIGRNPMFQILGEFRLEDRYSGLTIQDQRPRGLPRSSSLPHPLSTPGPKHPEGAMHWPETAAGGRFP